MPCKTHGPRSSAINLGEDIFSGPGRAVNIREESSLLKCREQILECFVSFQWVRLRSTKSIHFFRLLRHSLRSSPKAEFYAGQFHFRVCFIVTAVRHTAVRHNQKFLLKSRIVVAHDSLFSLRHANVDVLR